MPQIPEPYAGLASKAIVSVVILAFALLLNRVVGRVLKARVKEVGQMLTLRMLVRNTVFFVSGVIILLTWLGLGSDFTVAMGILGAGIAFASQEVIGSFAGYLNIITGNLYHIGDRVRIGNVVGDVIDITILRTVVMEIGEWVRADQYTGRMVTVANRVVFSDPVFNYTQHWAYLWDEIMIPITYDSNWRQAAEIMLDYGFEFCSPCLSDAQAGLQALRERYPLQEASVEPLLYVVMTDNWIEMTLRYVVAARDRRAVAGELHRRLLERFEAESDITVASATVEIVGFPPLKSDN
jgi:small-conductance mechanosensitive channel